MQKKIAIYGAGGLGREIASQILNKWFWGDPYEFIGFFDDALLPGTEISGLGTVLGGIDTLNAWPEALNVALCFGSPIILHTVSNKITNSNITFPNLFIQETVLLHYQSFKTGKGNIILGKSAFSVNVTLGDFNIFNGDVIVGHDTVIGNCNVFMNGMKISGSVKISNRNLFGVMSFVHQGLKIGNDIKLSPLSALLTKPKDNCTYIGNPAKKFKF